MPHERLELADLLIARMTPSADRAGAPAGFPCCYENVIHCKVKWVPVGTRDDATRLVPQLPRARLCDEESREKAATGLEVPAYGVQREREEIERQVIKERLRHAKIERRHLR